MKQFASEDATVVVGTVIDPELSNQVRVTVVATGLGRPAAAARPPVQRERRRRGREVREPGMRVVPRPRTASDYAAFERPTAHRQQRAVGDGLRPEAEAEDVLDIPAFLRRQAD